MSTVAPPKKDGSALGRAIHRSRGVTVIHNPPPVPKKPVKDNSNVKKLFDSMRLRVAATLEIYKKNTSVAGAVAEFNKRLKAADQAAEDESWDRANELIKALDGDLNQLPTLVGNERDAQKDCKDRFKELTSRIGEYQQLPSEQQDKALLKMLDGQFKSVQKLMADKSFATALKQIDEALRKLREAKLRAVWGDGTIVGDEAKKKLPKMLRVAVEREEQLAAHDLEVRVQAETLGEALGPEVGALMNEHRNALSFEVKCFKGYRWMDDVQTAMDGARKENNKDALKVIMKDAKAITETVADAKARQTKMMNLLKSIKETPENKEALAEAREFAGTMLGHISDTWVVEAPRLAQRLPMMLKSEDDRAKAKTEAMDIPKEQREKETALFKEVIEYGSLKGVDRTQFYFDETLRAIQRETPDERAVNRAKEAAELLKEYEQLDDEDKDKEFAKEMKEAITAADKQAKEAQVKLKKKGTTNEPDPTITTALMESTKASEDAIAELREALDLAGAPAETKDSSSQYERLMKTFDEIIQRAYKIRDAGGSVKDVESSLQHIPAEFWPPQFTENLQAWRKVERELAEERVADMFAKKDGFSFDDAKDCFNLAMETINVLNLSSGLHGASTGANDNNGWMAVPKVASLIQGYIDAVKNGFNCGSDAATAMETLDYTGLKPANLSDLYDNVAKVTSSLVSGITNIKNVPGIPESSVLIKEVIPILSAVAAGIDLTVAINALRKAITMRVKSGMMIDKAELEYFSGQLSDGGAFVKAIKNERDARKRQVGMKSVDVTSKAVVMSGEITKAAVGSGWGTEQAVGHGLVVAGKAIEYGGKIVFAGIDWGIARQVKQLIKEAQAGNPIARMELMENSGLYAKMYICILAKEGHKLSLVFVAQRGYDEQALMNPALSLKILREAMLAHADQKDETQVSDNLGVAISEGVTGKGVTKAFKLAGKGASALANKIKDLPKDKNIPYNAKWKPITPASLSPTDWQTNKADCIKKAGLYDESTGIDKVLKPCDGEIKATDEALNKYEQAKPKPPGDRVKLIALVRKTQSTMAKGGDVLINYYPGTNDGNVHEPMADYILDIRRILSTHNNRLEQRLSDLDLVKSDWTPPKTPGTDATDWISNWADAADKCDLAEADGGVGEALKTFEAAKKEVDSLGKDKTKEIRDKRVEIRDSLKEAGSTLKSLWSDCSSFPGVLDYIDAMTGYVIKESQNNDLALNGFDWTDNPAKDFANDKKCFGAAKWKATYEAADKMGFCDRKVKDGGMEKALLAWEKHPVRNTLASEDGKESLDPKDAVKKRKEGIKLLAEVAKGAEKLASANTDSHTEFLKYIAFLRRTAHAKVTEIQQQQDDVHFLVTSGTDPKAWETTYKAGVAAGAMPENSKAYKELDKALTSYSKALAAMDKAKQGKKPKEAYSEATKATAASAEIQKALGQVSGTEGWTNSRLVEFFDRVRDQVEHELKTGTIPETLGGEKATFAKHEFKFENKGSWQVVKKEAVNAGLTADSKSGFGELINAYVKADKAKASAEKNKAKKPDAFKQSFNVVIAKLKAIESSAKSMEKETKNANYIAYFKSAGKQCRDKIAELEKARPV